MAEPLIPGLADELTEELAGAAGSVSVKLFALALLDLERHEDGVLKRKPQVNDEDVTRDWRYRLGVMKGLELGAALPERAADLVERRAKRNA